MSNESVDPSGNTGQFKAFAQAPPQDAGSSRAPLVIGVIVALALIALTAFLALG
jgi:hypothetical protein